MKYRVAISGSYGGLNLGDEAILASGLGSGVIIAISPSVKSCDL
jgi:hypothetical protein